MPRFPVVRKSASLDLGDAFHALVNALPDSMIVVDDGIVAYANPAMHELLGEPMERGLTGRRLVDLIEAEDRPTVAETLSLASSTTGYGRLRIAWKRSAGRAVITECAVGRAPWQGRSAVQIVARDMTTRLESDAVIQRASENMARQIDEERAELGERRQQLVSEVLRRERAERDRDEVLARLALTAEHERRRLSRELHDEVGQHLTRLLLGLQGIVDVAGVGSEVDTRAKELQSLAQRLGTDLHDVAVRLRPKALDDFGIEAALRSYAAVWARETRIKADIQTTGNEARLPEPLETALYRIAQEALTNVARHSEATSVSVVLHKEARLCRLAIEDDGKGFDVDASRMGEAHSERLGLLGMRERARIAGGRLDIESAPGAGTSVFVRIPTGTDANPAGGGG